MCSKSLQPVFTAGLALLCAACATARLPQEQPSAALAANRTSNPLRVEAQKQTLLAVKVVITASGVQPVNSTIVRAPLPSNSAIQDLSVRTKANQTVLFDYTIADPRLAEVEGRQPLILPSAQAILYAPLSEQVTTLEVIALPGRPNVSKGGAFPIEELARRACRERRVLEECQALLNER
ncbi:hypothetical protein [Hyalangium rubrum]|uniref:Lipoprotein n=1 Tax=Hyalangium rubrum TaxID=3103134 RepID=A0ABU5GYA4_9BACT|nr:hypothetical protein [Hyalangium sp. s54d21]MDY7225674.1 hypothetical protein [Hyalangium sp. s54d21]